LIDMILQMYSTCLTCITAGIWHMEALSQNQQQQSYFVTSRKYCVQIYVVESRYQKNLLK